MRYSIEGLVLNHRQNQMENKINIFDLENAIKADNVEVVKQFLSSDRGFVENITIDGEHCIAYALKGRAYDSFKLLVEQERFNPNVTNKDGKPLLHIAAEYALGLFSKLDRRYLDTLLSHPNIDVNILDKDGLPIICKHSGIHCNTFVPHPNLIITRALSPVLEPVFYYLCSVIQDTSFGKKVIIKALTELQTENCDKQNFFQIKEQCTDTMMTLINSYLKDNNVVQDWENEISNPEIWQDTWLDTRLDELTEMVSGDCLESTADEHKIQMMNKLFTPITPDDRYYSTMTSDFPSFYPGLPY